MRSEEKSLPSTNLVALFNEHTDAQVEVLRLPEEFKTNYPRATQAELQRTYNVAKNVGNCIVVNFNRKYFCDGTSYDADGNDGKPEKKPIVAMNLIIGIDNKVICIDANEWDSFPLIVRLGEDYRPIAHIKRENEEDVFVQLDFICALLLTGRKKGNGKIKDCDVIQLVSSFSDEVGYSSCEAIAFPDCKPVYDFLNHIKWFYRHISGGGRNGNVQ